MEATGVRSFIVDLSLSVTNFLEQKRKYIDHAYIVIQ